MHAAGEDEDRCGRERGGYCERSSKVSCTGLDPVGVSEVEGGIESVSHLRVLLVQERVEIEVVQDIFAVQRAVL